MSRSRQGQPEDIVAPTQDGGALLCGLLYGAQPVIGIPVTDPSRPRCTAYKARLRASTEPAASTTTALQPLVPASMPT